MFSPSLEQQCIIDSIIKDEHVICNSVAGSGKTTTILSLAKQAPRLNFLQFTYNNLLRREVNSKVVKYCIDNLNIHTYHSFAVSFYNKNAFTDQGIKSIIDNDFKIDPSFPLIDVIIIDETQDMTLLYYHFIKKVMRDIHNTNLRIMIIGDEFQGMYEFKEADVRFLTLAPEIWPSFKFHSMQLNMSYRVTDSIAWFVNKCMLKDDRIKSCKPSQYPVEFMYHNSYQVQNLIFHEINKMLQTKEIKPDDIFVLAYSIKSEKAPIKKLENLFVMNGIKCYMPLSDETKVDEDVIKNKVVFSTFHQSKGRERPVVVIYGFDSTYFDYYDKESNPDKCPSTLYVAATRASKRLFIICDVKNQHLPFLRLQYSPHIKYITGTAANKSCIDQKILHNIDCAKKHDVDKLESDRNCHVTDLIKFIKEEHMHVLTKFVKTLYSRQQTTETRIHIPDKIQNTNGNVEHVSDLNGLSIINMFEVLTSNTNTLLQSLDEYASKNSNHFFYEKYLSNVQRSSKTINDFLYIANVYSCTLVNVFYRLAQIEEYNWLSYDMIEACHSNIRKQIVASSSLRYEVSLKYSVWGNVKLFGRIDAIDDTTIWELKCVSELSLEHFLQLIVYAWCWKQSMEKTHGKRVFKLMNVRTNEVYILDTIVHEEDIDTVCTILFKNKYGTQSKLDDVSFITSCIQNTSMVIQFDNTCLSFILCDHIFTVIRTEQKNDFKVATSNLLKSLKMVSYIFMYHETSYLALKSKWIESNMQDVVKEFDKKLVIYIYHGVYKQPPTIHEVLDIIKSINLDSDNVSSFFKHMCLKNLVHYCKMHNIKQYTGKKKKELIQHIMASKYYSK